MAAMVARPHINYGSTDSILVNRYLRPLLEDYDSEKSRSTLVFQSLFSIGPQRSNVLE